MSSSDTLVFTPESLAQRQVSLPSRIPGARPFGINATLSDLVLFEFTLDADAPGSALQSGFDANSLLPGAVLVEQTRLIGMVSRAAFLRQLSRPFGQELFLNRPARSLLRFTGANPLLLSDCTPIVLAAEKAIVRDADGLHEPVVVEVSPGIYRLLDTHQLLLAQAHIHQVTTGLLRETQQKLVESAHLAGKAEIATDVLHHMGNALNSLNTSAQVLEESLEAMSFDRLERLMELFQRSPEELSRFFVEDPRAQQLPGAFFKVVKGLRRPCETAKREIAQLIAGIRSVHDVVRSQEAYAGSADLLERVELRAVLEDALKIQVTFIQGLQIETRLNCEIEPVLSLPRLKILQIFRHLIKNACEAMAASEKKSLHIRVSAGPTARPRIEFQDTGVGIEPEQMTKIFSAGYSSKGQPGLGLHYCANTLGECGATIGVKSQGIGKGSCFVIEFGEVLGLDSSQFRNET